MVRRSSIVVASKPHRLRSPSDPGALTSASVAPPQPRDQRRAVGPSGRR